MRKVSISFRRLSAALLFFAATGLFAEPYVDQSAIAPFSIEDQHGNAHTVDTTARAVLFSRDMDGGAVIKDALGENGEALLKSSGALYVADISGMPWLVRKMIAKPRMRERPYLMLLDEDGELTEDFPSVAGKATLMVVDRLKIVRIEHMGSAAELRKALEALSTAP